MESRTLETNGSITKICRGYDNETYLEFDAISANESFARLVVSSFIAGLNPTVEELADVKTAVSEAVTNAIIHAYSDESGKVELKAEIQGNDVVIEIRDYGVGIPANPHAYRLCCGVIHHLGGNYVQ